MWYNITRDFQTFSEPKVWQNPAPQSRIDTTAIKVGDQYYRVTKNEAGNAGSDIFSEKNTDFLDSDITNWQLVAPALGRTTWQATAGYEGPVIFEANPGDTACPGQFYLWGDRYTNGGGYQAACEANIEAPTWQREDHHDDERRGPASAPRNGAADHAARVEQHPRDPERAMSRLPSTVAVDDVRRSGAAG